MWGLMMLLMATMMIFLFWSSFMLLHVMLAVLWPTFIIVLMMNYMLMTVFDLSKKSRYLMISALLFFAVCLFFWFVTVDLLSDYNIAFWNSLCCFIVDVVEYFYFSCQNVKKYIENFDNLF